MLLNYVTSAGSTEQPLQSQRGYDKRFDPITLGLIGLGLSGITGLIGNWMTNRNNRNIAREAQDFEREQIDKQNAYNSPASQMQRYIEAGLNPNLMYSQGSSGNQSQHASGRTYDYKNPLDGLDSVFGMLSQYQDYKLKEAQIKQIEVQTNNVSDRLGMFRDTHSMDYSERNVLIPEVAQAFGATPKQVYNEGTRRFQSFYTFNAGTNYEQNVPAHYLNAQYEAKFKLGLLKSGATKAEADATASSIVSQRNIARAKAEMRLAENYMTLSDPLEFRVYAGRKKGLVTMDEAIGLMVAKGLGSVLDSFGKAYGRFKPKATKPNFRY